MRTRRNFLSSYFTSLASCLRSWVVLLASLWVIILSPALVAETIVIPDPSRTNQFTTVEAWVELNYSTNVICLTWDEFNDHYWPNIMGECNWIREQCESYFWNVYYTGENIHQYLRDFEDNADWPDDFSDQFAQDWENLVTSINWEYLGFQSQAYDFLAEVTNSVTIIESTMLELSNLETNVISSVTFGQEYGRSVPGGCECPDYTQYLTYIAACLTQIQQAIDKWDGYLTSFRTGLLSFFTSDQDFGEAMSLVLKSLSDLSEGSEGLLSLSDTSMVEFGSRLTELLLTLSYVQLGDVSSLSYHNVASNLYAHLIDGWCFPTNTADRPLWVTCDQSELATLLDDVLARALLQVSVTNDLQVSVTNSLQVAVTNAVEVFVSVSNEVSQINNNFTEIEDLAGRLEVEEVNEITDSIDDRTTLFDGWDLRIRQFPERFESLWQTQYILPESVLIYDGFSALAPQGGFDGWGGSRRARANTGFESVMDVPSLELYIGPNSDTASGRWIYRIAQACHNVSNVIWSLLFLAIVVKLFKIDIFLLRSSIFIFLAWLSCLGVGGMRRLSITEAMAESFDRIAKLFTSMFGDEDAA